MSAKKILLVEDDVKLRFTLETVLRSHGFEVTAFGTAEDAKKNLDGAMAAIIDVRLPDQQGDALAREIREKNPAARLIIITAYDAAGLGQLLPGVVVLVKPIEIEDLLKLL